jgi:hypothetical protein
MSAPVITNRSPDPSFAVGPTDPVSMDITTDVGFLEILILARFEGTNLYEVAYDSSGFAPLYVEQSQKVSIAGGFRFTVRRKGGWPGALTLKTLVIDTNGAEAT